MNNSSIFHVLDVCSKPTDLDHKDFFETSQFITGLVLYPLICSFGIAANLVSIWIILYCKISSTTNVFLVALAISDTVKLCNDFLYFISILEQRINPESAQFFGRMYPYSHYIMHASSCITAWITVSITIERYIVVFFPNTAKEWCTLKWSKVSIFFVFTSMCCITLPHLQRYETVPCIDDNQFNNISYEVRETKNWRESNLSRFHVWLLNSLRVLVPIAILCVLNVFIVRTLRRIHSRHRIINRHRITVMLVVIVMVFVVCSLPDAILSTIFNLGFVEENYLIRGIREFTDLLIVINSASNFFLYFTFNTIFKNQFLQMFCWACVEQKPKLTIETPTVEDGSGSSKIQCYIKLEYTQQSRSPRHSNSNCNPEDIQACYYSTAEHDDVDQYSWLCAGGRKSMQKNMNGKGTISNKHKEVSNPDNSAGENLQRRSKSQVNLSNSQQLHQSIDAKGSIKKSNSISAPNGVQIVRMKTQKRLNLEIPNADADGNEVTATNTNVQPEPELCS